MRNINKSNKRALFITYDGLRDPLGQSQILPYLKIISRYVKYLHVISFEKKQTEKQEKVTLPKNVGWTKLTFSHGGIFYKFLDLILMIFKTFLLIKKYKFNILHARSYPSMHVVYLLNKIFDFKSIFDMRGFWVDDRIDANIWSKNKFLYRIIANYYKNLEKKFVHKNLYSSVFAYNPMNHRHICEIDQQLFKYTKRKIIFSFNPHLLPTFRGILTAIYVQTVKGKSGNSLRKILTKFYKNSKFVKILKLNATLGSGNVLNTNNCEISICETRVKNNYIIFSAIDNLVKGASGQAVQNMNLLYKFPENLGLK